MACVTNSLDYEGGDIPMNYEVYKELRGSNAREGGGIRGKLERLRRGP